MTVQARAQTLLVEKVRDEADAAPEHEETVEDAHGEVLLGLVGAEGAAVAQQVDKAHGDATVDVQDQVVLLGRRHALDREREVEQLRARKALLAEVLDQLDSEIRVVARLDAVADAGDCRRRRSAGPHHHHLVVQMRVCVCVCARAKEDERVTETKTHSACSASSSRRRNHVG